MRVWKVLIRRGECREKVLLACALCVLAAVFRRFCSIAGAHFAAFALFREIDFEDLEFGSELARGNFGELIHAPQKKER